ncbi:ubiquitin-protein transferase activating protein, partial [Serendipita sp. 399]
MSTATRKVPSKTKTPKAPSRGRKDQREPLTPSLSHALSGLNINNTNTEPTPTTTTSKHGRQDTGSASPVKFMALGDPDVSINPFLETSVPIGQSLKTTAIFGSGGANARASGSKPSSRPGSRAGSRPSSRAGSRPTTPNKRSKSAHSARNTVSLYGMETKLDIIDISEWSMNNTQQKKEKDAVSKEPTPRKRSKSQSSVRPRSGTEDYGDRYFADRNPHATVLSFSPPRAGSTENSPAHIARLAAAANLEPDGRILTFHQAPPTSNADPMLAAQRTHVQPLYAREKSGSSVPLPGASGSSASSSTTAKVRKLPTQPDRVLDAPGIMDDYYLNLLAWSSRNELAVGLEENTYVWRASTGAAFQLAESTEGRWVTSLDWSTDGAFLAIGMSNGDVELWDVEAERRLRTMTGHQAQVACLSWNNHVLSSGCQDGSIWHHDVRVARHHQGTLIGHVGEVCGLKWRSDGGLLASGGNDNVVNVWDSRTGSGDANGELYEQRTAKWTKRNHTAAVK